MKKFKKIILCTCLSIALLSAYGCSSSQDSTNKTTEASMTDATKSDVTDNTSEEVAEDTEKVSEEAVSEDTAEDTSEATTETVAKGDDKKAEATTEGRAESKTENTPATTQTATTQAQSTTQQSKPSNSGNNGNSQNNSQTTTSHSHTWVNHTKIVHHDAEYEDRTVTKYKDEVYSVLICNQCGADITNIGSTAHYAASGTMWVNGGTAENPWWVEVERCSSCHSEWRHRDVPYTETEKVKVKDAYDEEVTDYQYCSGCGQRK